MERACQNDDDDYNSDDDETPRFHRAQLTHFNFLTVQAFNTHKITCSHFWHVITTSRHQNKTQYSPDFPQHKEHNIIQKATSADQRPGLVCVATTLL